MHRYSFEPIGYIHSCFKEKFGVPRQPGLVKDARATIKIAAPYGQAEAFRHLASFSHLWVLFVFHKSVRQRWKTTVRPPRLGGNQRVGVFASRSGFRPNAIGQSAVELVAIESEKGSTKLLIGGADLLDGTPVLDIKPYLPYSDIIPKAKAGYAAEQPKSRWPVRFSEPADRQCTREEQARYPGLRKLIMDLLALDPRPGYQGNEDTKSHGMRLWDLNINFRFERDHITVTAIDSVYAEP